jgi:hypothetical protein
MAAQTVTIFPHRHNHDGSFDSICPICYSTVSNNENETELARDESTHVCNGVFMRAPLPATRDRKE